MIVLEFHQDASHGWIKVPHSTFALVSGFNPSTFSYYDSEAFYLEEDEDANKFLTKLDEAGYEYALTPVYDGDRSPIRDLKHVRGRSTVRKVFS